MCDLSSVDTAARRLKVPQIRCRPVLTITGAGGLLAEAPRFMENDDGIAPC